MFGFGWFLTAAAATSGSPRVLAGGGVSAVLGAPVPAAAFSAQPLLRSAPASPAVAAEPRSSAPALLAKGFGAKKAKKAKKVRSSSAPAEPQVVSQSEQRSIAEERGRKLLEDMRRESDGGDVQPKKPGMQLTPEELRPLAPGEDVMPEAVANRMLQRIIPFAALPVAAAFLLLVGFYIANTKLDYDIPPQIVAYATQAMLLLSFAGITYGVMSTELDEEKEQTLLGAENVKRNFDSMRGVEFDRIAEAKAEEEMEDAESMGIVMNQEQLAKKREREAQNTRL
jgi:hypothetical protein